MWQPGACPEASRPKQVPWRPHTAACRPRKAPGAQKVAQLLIASLPAEAPLEHNFRYPRIREHSVDNDGIALGGCEIAPAPFDTPTYRLDPISYCSIMPQSWNPLYTSHRHPKQPQNSKIALVTCPYVFVSAVKKETRAVFGCS